MVKLNKIYTKTGDKGLTGLVSGKRVSKDNARIKAYGTVDELNSILGMVRIKSSKKINSIIAEIQNDLFDLGADLATPIEKKPKFILTGGKVGPSFLDFRYPYIHSFLTDKYYIYDELNDWKILKKISSD